MAPSPRDRSDTQAPLITVIVCTAGRRPSLLRLLDSLARLDDEAFEVLIVDNGRDARVAHALRDRPGIRTVREPRRGLDRARNRGIVAARGAIIAFIDDDCEADPGWLTAIRGGFADPRTSCVTGRVVAANVSLAPQRWFEERFSFDRGPRPLRFRLDHVEEWFPVHPSHLGSGCNMAFRRDVFDRIGGFDPALDMGTAVEGGGDLDLFARLIDAGETATYVPSAMVHHHHRSRRRSLVRQFVGYGATVSALGVKTLLRRPPLRRAALRFVSWYVADLFGRLGDRVRRRSYFPLYLTLAELLGLAAGPILYLWSSLATRWRGP